MTNLSRLTSVDPRSVWPNEAHDFTPWLLENADVLADSLGIEADLTAAEHPVGAFSLDLLGRDITNDCVLIVENQLTPTDHDHLGKLVTYAAGTEAKTIVWIAPAFREEHRQAISFLNDLGGDDVRFFGIEVRAVRIGDSDIAPLLELRAQPNDWHARLSTSARRTSEGGRAALYSQFWGQLLDQIRREHPGWTRATTPPSTNWFSMSSPFKGGPFFAISFGLGRRLRSELYVDFPDGDRADALFAALARRRTEIEARYGSALSWEELPEKRASRVADYREGEIVESADYEAYSAWFIESNGRLRAAIDAVAPAILDELDSPG